MNVLSFLTLVLVGFTACAEFGSYAFVHPVLRRLPPREWIQVEQGLLRTFGRFMPFAMPISLIVAIVFASVTEGAGGGLRWLAVTALAIAVTTTVAVNVGINRTTGTWDPDHPPANWRQTRAKWERFQGLRSWLLLVGFVLLTAAVTLP